jgi:hypothetical protein
MAGTVPAKEDAMSEKIDLLNLLFTAEMENLLTHDNLHRWKRFSGRWQKASDHRIHSLMGLRHISLHMRFGQFGFELEYLTEYESDLRDIIAKAGVAVRAFEPSKTEMSDQDFARLEALRCRLNDALADTTYARQCAKESEDARRQAYRELTADTFFNQW